MDERKIHLFSQYSFVIKTSHICHTTKIAQNVMDVVKYRAMTPTSHFTSVEDVMELDTKPATDAMAPERFKANPLTQEGNGKIQLTSL